MKNVDVNVWKAVLNRVFSAVLCVLGGVAFAQSAAEAPLLRSTVSPSITYDTSGGPVRFVYQYKEGDSSRVLSTVNEDVFINRRLSHRAVIVNRISTKVTETREDGAAVEEGTFMTSENSTRAGTGAIFTYGEEYKSKFVRDKLGVYTISDEYFMPTVRDVPVFPDREVLPGETWTAEGHEAHDLRRQFDLKTPYKVPFTATYTYLGTLKREGGAPLHAINVKYTLYAETPAPSASLMEDYPVMMMGFSDELIYWDNEKGAIDHYGENFRIVMQTAYGSVIEFRGTAHAEVTEFVRTATEEKLAEVQAQVEQMGIDDVTVKKSDKGLTLSIENIQFKAESAELMASEKRKIEKLAKILEAYPDNDILVSGHTAHFPGGEDPQVLSEERAKSVARYLINLGVRDEYHVFTQGLGDTVPIAPNDTREGRSKNRRVEITIMDE